MHNGHMREVENVIGNYKNKRSSEEIYQEIVNRLKIIAKDELSDKEAHSAARNLIGFCQEIVDYKAKRQKEEKFYKIKIKPIF